MPHSPTNRLDTMSRVSSGDVRRPNLLFLLSDQHRWFDLGCNGNNDVDTPSFDRLASTGLRFEHCISNTPLCVPSRASLLTGMLGQRHRAITNDLPIDTSVESIADVLRSAGYRTGYIGKWHLDGVPRDKPTPAGRRRLGFDTWKAYNCHHDYMRATYYDEVDRLHKIAGYEPTAQTELAEEFINESGDEPWALYLSWGPPHSPYRDVPAEFLVEYDRKELQLRPNVPEVIVERFDKQLGRGELRRRLAGYYAHISALDRELGRLLEVLNRRGLRDHTIVVYTSDHGDMLGSHGWTNKQLPYDEAIRVPLLVSWPGAVRAGATSELMGLVDLPVSLLGLMGLSFSSATDGVDQSAVMLDEHATGRTECYVTDVVPAHQAADRGGKSWRAIRTSTHTFVRTVEDGDGGGLLFDNVGDPYQLDNLIDSEAHREARDDLAARLDQQIDRHDALIPWDELVRAWGLVEQWNASQRYFGRPEMRAGYPASL